MDTNHQSEFERDHFDPDAFFSTFWRKKPMFVRGGADTLLGRRWTCADFEAVETKARSEVRAIKERPGEVTFIEKASAFDPDLAARAASLCSTFGAPQVWFDAIQTRAPSGIGSHFDHSDNFVLQQDGVKEWTLASPRHISRSDIARRMMNTPGVGAHPMPEEDTLHFTLGPGDLLYIPLLWVHSGISRATSLSVSLVCPAVSLHAAVIPFLTRAMAARALGYQPVPAFHKHLSPEERTAAAATLRQATRALLDRVTDDELLEEVVAMQADRLGVL